MRRVRTIKADQHEGNKLLTATYCFGLLNSHHLCTPPPKLLFPSLTPLLPPMAPNKKKKGSKLSAKNNLSVFLLFLAAADRLKAAFQEKKQRTPHPRPSLWVFFNPPSLPLSICLHIPHFPSFALTGHFLKPSPPLSFFLTSPTKRASHVESKRHMDRKSPTLTRHHRPVKQVVIWVGGTFNKTYYSTSASCSTH